MAAFRPKQNVSVRHGTYYDWSYGGNNATGGYSSIVESFNPGEFVSISHRRDKDGVYRSGGPWFCSFKDAIHYLSAPATIFRPYGGRAYVGSVRLFGESQRCAVPIWDPAFKSKRESDLDNRGAEAWNRMRPDNPDFSFATSLYELKDTPGMLKDLLGGLIRKDPRLGRRSTISKTGQWHLAIQFGYLPLLGDILSFVAAQRGGQKRLKQLIRDAERPIRRKVNLSDEGSQSTIESSSITYYTLGSDGTPHAPSFVTQCYDRSPRGWKKRVWQYSARTWAEGRFRYFLPDGPRDVIWKKKMLRRIMGARITPAVLYEAVPWSWLVDYFTDLGQFVKAISPGVADRLVADYCYIMRSEEWNTTVTSDMGYKASYNGEKSVRLTPSVVIRSVVKQRRHASPFGFGVKQSSLTAKQIGILGGLGYSKLP